MDVPTTLTIFNPDAGLAPLVDKARGYVAAAKAANTVRAYQSDWRYFTGWYTVSGLVQLPTAPETIALYIADLGGIAKPSTITRRLAVIVKSYQAVGHDSPCARWVTQPS